MQTECRASSLIERYAEVKLCLCKDTIYSIFSKHPKDGITDIIMKRHYSIHSIYYISATYTAFYI